MSNSYNTANEQNFSHSWGKKYGNEKTQSEKQAAELKFHKLRAKYKHVTIKIYKNRR